MCNAWNHPSGCTCGWGGDGHAGVRGAFSYTFHSTTVQSVLDSGFSYESFTNPNATCPVCGAPVFFYQSPYGGRVFFDELGPPWPKHPCTDNGHSHISAATQHTTRTKTFSWQKSGWKPFHVSEWTVSAKGILEITGTLYGDKLKLEVSKEVVVNELSSWSSQERIAQLRKVRDGKYDLSILDPKGKPFYFPARSKAAFVVALQEKCDFPSTALGQAFAKAVRTNSEEN